MACLTFCHVDKVVPLKKVKYKEVDLIERDIMMICNLYWEQETTIRSGKNTPFISTEREVRQECVLSIVYLIMFF
uniref:Uncharacterized protein n=1 Tax=Arion vulgaris TaxID=1028688 RepID=A0A0B6ZWV4_9EUPU